MQRPGGLVSVVDDFKYLGSTITKDCNLDKEINVWISIRHLVVSAVSTSVLRHQRGVKVKTKLRTFKLVVLPTLLYSSETWTPVASHIKCLEGFLIRRDTAWKYQCGTREGTQN